MKINVWQVPSSYLMDRRNNPAAHTVFYIDHKGYIELEKFSAHECWHLANWSCWDDERPEAMKACEVSYANSDIVFHDPEKDEYHIALISGWHVEKTFEGVVNYLCR